MDLLLILVPDPDSGILDAVAWGHNETYYTQLVQHEKIHYYLIIYTRKCMHTSTHTQ